MTLDERITFNPEQCGGRPCIRSMRIRVADILEMLAQGVSEATILADFPDLEQDDIRACLHFAAQRSGIARLAARPTPASSGQFCAAPIRRTAIWIFWSMRCQAQR